MEFDLTRVDSSSEEGSDSEPEAWWEGLNLVVKTIMTLKSQFLATLMCPAPDHAVDCGRHAIPVSPATDPPIPIARVHVAVRCSQATTVGGGSQNSLTMQWMLRPGQSHNHSVQHIMIRPKWKRRCEDVDILPRPSRD